MPSAKFHASVAVNGGAAQYLSFQPDTCPGKEEIKAFGPLHSYMLWISEQADFIVTDFRQQKKKRDLTPESSWQK